MPQFEGDLNARGHRYGIVAARFNRPITERLLTAAYECLIGHGVAEKEISLAWVPGAFEIPIAAKQLALSKKVDGVICLGAVIRGETPHFDFVAGQMASGIMNVSLESMVPIIFSVLTTNTIEQAETRSGIKGTNAGFQGAMAAIEMVNLLKKLPCD